MAVVTVEKHFDNVEPHLPERFISEPVHRGFAHARKLACGHGFSAAEVRASIDRKVEAWRQQIAAQRSDTGE